LDFQINFQSIDHSLPMNVWHTPCSFEASI
jgi:hypothetical protein